MKNSYIAEVKLSRRLSKLDRKYSRNAKVAVVLGKFSLSKAVKRCKRKMK